MTVTCSRVRKILLRRERAAEAARAPKARKKSADTCPDRSCSGKLPLV